MNSAPLPAEGQYRTADSAPLSAEGRLTRGGSLVRWLAVGVVVGAVYLVWVAATLRHGDPRDFIHIGRLFATHSTASSVISSRAGEFKYDGEIGFDGQFAYFIAVDPAHAAGYLDNPPYRYTRILYPIVASALALGNPNLVPYSLIALNLLMIAAGTLALGAWLRLKGLSAWFAAVYGFYPGVFITLQRDTTEIMAGALVAIAILLYAIPTRVRLPASAVAFALAALTREVAVLFAIVWAFDVLLRGEVGWRRSLPRAALFGAIAVGPLLIWKLFLLAWLGGLGVQGTLTPIPFGGILYYAGRHELQVEQLRTVILPALLCGLAVIAALKWRIWRVEVAALGVNLVFNFVLLGPGSYNDISSSARVTVPLALSAVLCVPYFLPRALAWFWASAALWLAPMVSWLGIPTAEALLGALRHRL